MSQAMLNVRIDPEDKLRFDEFCSSVGMNVSTAVVMFVKAVLRENRLPFEVRSPLGTNNPAAFSSHIADRAATAGAKRLRGALSEYADPALARKEEGAWLRSKAEKHGDV